MKVLIIDIQIGVIFRGNATIIKFPGIDGYFQILNNHAKMLSILKIGIIELHTSLKKEKIIKLKVYNSGLLEVNNNMTNILLS